MRKEREEWDEQAVNRAFGGSWEGDDRWMIDGNVKELHRLIEKKPKLF